MIEQTQKRPIYLDYAATTPVDPRVALAMQPYLGIEGHFGNASSGFHVYGWEAASAIEAAATQVSDLIKAHPKEIIWTSCATEANNLAIKGVCLVADPKKRHFVTVETEHKSVLEPYRALQKQGFEVTYLKPDCAGLLDIDQLEKAILPETLMVSVMHVNNETGVIQDLKAISELTHRKGVLCHVDAVQSVGKLAIDLQDLKVDLMSFSAHKNYGPKGIGALFVRRHPRVWLEPQLHGGGQQQGLRSGTLPTHQIVGMGEAFLISTQEMQAENARIFLLRERLRKGLLLLGDVYVNGSLDHRVCGNLNVRFKDLEGSTLIQALTGMAISSGSACISTHSESSYVLRAMGLTEKEIASSLRFTLGRYTTSTEIELAIAEVAEVVKQLRGK